MSELKEALSHLAERIGGVRAALVIEASGIEVATWGEADFETVAAELAELWSRIGSTEALAPGGPAGEVEVRGPGGGWIAVPVGSDYILALLTGRDVPPGKTRFYAREWALEHREEFA